LSRTVKTRRKTVKENLEEIEGILMEEDKSRKNGSKTNTKNNIGRNSEDKKKKNLFGGKLQKNLTKMKEAFMKEPNFAYQQDDQQRGTDY
jgi:hypothetical protein